MPRWAGISTRCGRWSPSTAAGTGARSRPMPRIPGRWRRCAGAGPDMTRAQIALLPDGRRLHLQDGPIDLIVEAWGERAAIEAAYEAASTRFATILDELCAELPLLRTAAKPDACDLTGIVARRMHGAVVPFADRIFITPMSAVAGAVAEEILGAMLAVAPLTRAYVNNGGGTARLFTPRQTTTSTTILPSHRPRPR